MILGFAVMAILALMACALLYAAENKAKALSNELFKERAISSTLRNEKHHEWERAEVLQGEVYALKQDIADLKTKPEQEFKQLQEEQQDELGFGQHVKWRSTKKPTSQTYRLHFDIEPNGQRILEELTARFKRNVFTDDERETCRRIGRAEVVDFIISRINTANDPRYTEQLELAHMEQNDE
ncbi:Bbp19 family protein [Acinetobacter indicus]|uniref:Bbp19 family protein n=1 Tax=Acinetobacter indicus TaxID=756892 RepID=UPI00398A2E37